MLNFTTIRGKNNNSSFYTCKRRNGGIVKTYFVSYQPDYSKGSSSNKFYKYCIF